MILFFGVKSERGGTKCEGRKTRKEGRPKRHWHQCSADIGVSDGNRERARRWLDTNGSPRRIEIACCSRHASAAMTFRMYFLAMDAVVPFLNNFLSISIIRRYHRGVNSKSPTQISGAYLSLLQNQRLNARLGFLATSFPNPSLSKGQGTQYNNNIRSATNGEKSKCR